MGYRVGLKKKGCLRLCSKVRVGLFFGIQKTIDSMSKLAADLHTLSGRRRTEQQRRQTGVKENIVRGVSARGDPTLGLSCANLSMRVSKNGTEQGG